MTKTKDVCVILRGLVVVARPGEPRCLRPSLSAFVYLPRPLHPFAVRRQPGRQHFAPVAGCWVWPAVVITCAAVAVADLRLHGEKKGREHGPKLHPALATGRAPEGRNALFSLV